MINKIEEWGKWARHHKDDLGGHLRTMDIWVKQGLIKL